MALDVQAVHIAITSNDHVFLGAHDSVDQHRPHLPTTDVVGELHASVFGVLAVKFEKLSECFQMNFNSNEQTGRIEALERVGTDPLLGSSKFGMIKPVLLESLLLTIQSLLLAWSEKKGYL